MDNFTADLQLLENLSKRISDLIDINDLSQISYVDKQRRALIKKITDSEHKKNDIKKSTEILTRKGTQWSGGPSVSWPLKTIQTQVSQAPRDNIKP